MQNITQIKTLLVNLELALKQAGLWSNKLPSAEILTSQAPFASDVARFEQWLQFILIPEFLRRIENNELLPEAMATAPMAEITLTGENDVLNILKKLDKAVCGG